MLKILLLLVVSLFFGNAIAQTNTILMFIPHEEVYYSEYIVMKEALEATGYTVDVRSSSANPSSTYMAASQSTIEITANALSGSSYLQFTNQFAELFGSPWDQSNDTIPVAGIAVSGLIQDIADMSAYDALIVVGGTGALAYRIDANYSDQGELSAGEVQNAAEKLNQLALDALSSNKPVMTQCHGASLSAFWRIPGTVGPGAESLGYSLVKNGYVTGFPFPASLLTNYTTALDINPVAQDRVTISSPHSSFYDTYGAPLGSGMSKILTTRDWYPQSIGYAAETLINILRSYPPISVLDSPINTLIIHGGEVDCSPGSNTDIPCNFGAAVENIPADYLNIAAVLQADSPYDHINFIVNDVNIADNPLPFDINNLSSITNYLLQFDSIIFFKHWSTDITLELQQAIVDYADNGGTVVGLHHAAFNQVINANVNKNLLVQLFGVQSLLSTWSGSELESQNLTMAQYGHFITSFGTDSMVNPILSPTNGFETGANTSFSTQHAFQIFDEVYRNWELVAGQEFGLGINQLTPLLKNDVTSIASDTQQDFAGLVKRYDGNLDGTIGQIVFMMSGERTQSININHPYGQLIRNSAAWINLDKTVNQAPTITSFNSVSVIENQTAILTVTATDPDDDELSFSITGNDDDNLFSITPTGVLSFITAPNFEAGSNLYTLTVTATDNGSPVLEDNQIVSVTVLEEAIFFNGFEEL